MVLGVQWLRTLGSILWNFVHARLSCWCDNHHMEWHGMATHDVLATVCMMALTDLMVPLL
jgi:hypothetical protein